MTPTVFDYLPHHHPSRHFGPELINRAAATVRRLEGDAGQWDGSVERMLALPRVAKLLDADPELQMAFAVHAGADLPLALHMYDPSDVRLVGLVVLRLLEHELPFVASDLCALVGSASAFLDGATARGAQVEAHTLDRAIETGCVVAARLADFAGENEVGVELLHEARVLDELLGRVGGRGDGARRRLEDLLAGPSPLPLVPSDPWGARALADLEQDVAEASAAWAELLLHATTANKPAATKKWLKQAAPLLAAVGPEHFEARVATWFRVIRSCEAALDDGMNTLMVRDVPSPISDVGTNTLNGLVWLTGSLGTQGAPALLAEVTLRCFVKVPGIGPVSKRIGGSAMRTLAAIPDTVAIGHLSRLAGRLTYAQARKQVERLLDKRAEQAGMSRQEIEDLGVPTFDLDASGARTTSLGEATVTLRLMGGTAAALEWRNAKGKPAKIAPKAVREAHGDQVKVLARERKNLETMLATQRDRFDRGLVERRTWTVERWRERVLRHPLLGALGQALLWTVVANGSEASFGIEGERLVGLDGQDVPWPADDAEVRLWHPLDATTEDVLGWRAWIVDRGRTQPFAQAHREVYVLTDAERETATYSNRFAAHVLRHHQLAELAKVRRWRFRVVRKMDEPGPALELPEHGLRCELAIDGVWDPVSDRGIPLYVVSDRIRFVRAMDGEPIELAQVPERLFSEVLRDVDLFVSVTSVGNDPTWAEQRGQPRREYWDTYAMGSLLPSGAARRTTLASIVPRLGIADRLAIDGRHLRVEGKLDAYRIHLGSANVIRESDGRYVCIARGRKTMGVPATVALPFEGDGLLALILSKALLLARDDEIDDPAIRSQLRTTT